MIVTFEVWKCRCHWIKSAPWRILFNIFMLPQNPVTSKSTFFFLFLEVFLGMQHDWYRGTLALGQPDLFQFYSILYKTECSKDSCMSCNSEVCEKWNIKYKRTIKLISSKLFWRQIYHTVYIWYTTKLHQCFAEMLFIVTIITIIEFACTG